MEVPYFCANCGHHINCHDIDRVPVCDYDATSSLPMGSKRRTNCTVF